MNRILFETVEIVDGQAEFGGVRAEHVMTVLHGEIGQRLKTGEVNGRIGTSEIIEIEKSTEWRIRVRVEHEEKALKPWVDLILAPPRPRVMKRLLPQLAAMGVGRIALVGAEKVEKDFWGATLLREENYRPLLIDGLMQAGTTALPTIETWRSFRRFLREGLADWPTGNRYVGHPTKEQEQQGGSARSGDPSPLPTESSTSRAVVAIGPEGGWTEAEVEALEQAGFRRYSLGRRILKTDTATIALLAQLNKEYEK